MRQLLASCFVIAAICFSSWSADEAITFAQDAGGNAAALQSDTSLQLALKKKDAKAVGALLDPQFSWTNEAGQTQMSAQFLRDAAAGTAVGDTEYNDVKAREYGQLAILTGIAKRTGDPIATRRSTSTHQWEGTRCREAAMGRLTPAPVRRMSLDRRYAATVRHTLSGSTTFVA